MTTVTEKLLAKADEYEQKAKALRFAAEEMNGHAVNGKQKAAVGTLDAAIALRKAQRNGRGHNVHDRPSRSPNNHHTLQTAPERMARIRAFLADGPKGSAAIFADLEAHELGCSYSHLGKTLKNMRGVTLNGFGRQSTWQLGAGKAKRAAPGSRLADKRAARELTAKVLDAYDREQPKVPGEVAKALGLTVPKSGFAPLVHQGYLKKRGKDGGYIRTAKPYVVENAPATA